MVTKTITRMKTHETVKNELMNLLRKNNAVEEPGLNINNVIHLREASSIINCYKEIIKTQNKKSIGYRDKY